jgi:hypothetical protein
MLLDKTTIHYWYKKPDELILHQLHKIITEEQLHGLKRVDFTIGGDHGGGKFHVTLKMLLQFHEKNLSHIFSKSPVFLIPKMTFPSLDLLAFIQLVKV